jgi:phospholipid/cholesterol/gamma-HCH transport system permease protein
MSSISTPAPSRRPLDLVGRVGKSVIDGLAYVGGVAVLLLRAAGWLIWPWQSRRHEGQPRLFKSVMHQLFWMLLMGIPLVALVHVAIGSFLALQAYYGSTFVDGTGAVVGVGLLRNLGGIMSGMTFSGILAARMIPELRELSRRVSLEETEIADRPSGPRSGGRGASNSSAVETIHADFGSVVAPRVAAAAIACVLLTLWGITTGTVVGWVASESLMGLSTEMFFMMMLKMMWYRDVLGLVAKGMMFGALPAAICCFEGLGRCPNEDDGPATARGFWACASVERSRFPCCLHFDGRDPGHELELVHARVSRCAFLRPDIAAAALARMKDGCLEGA